MARQISWPRKGCFCPLFASIALICAGVNLTCTGWLSALLEKETDCPEQMICAWRVRRIVQRELVVDFQDDLWRREQSHAKSMKLSLTLPGWQVLIDSG